MSGPDQQELTAIARELGAALRKRRWRMATAESSTGGLIGHVITGVPGASEHYAGGVICYSNQAKEVSAGVPHELIVQYGAVSAEVASAMAVGAADRFEAELGVSVTGIAGPGGGSERKPVGTHFVGISLRGYPARAEHHVFGHDREGNKAAAALAALSQARDAVLAAIEKG
ncbi:MAG: CinA family protein [Chloroflexota bacterium]|nr:CinA family protein [Chloroflexota bacterium]